MTIEPEPLDPAIRRSLERVAVPDGLEARIRASVARKRRSTFAIAAAALMVFVASAIFLWPAPVEPLPVGPTVSITQPPPLPLTIQEIQIDTRVEVDGNTLTFNFVHGGDPYE